MSGTPKWKVYRDKEYVAACKYASDAAAVVGLTGHGTVKYDHSLIVWREGSERVSASESYDEAAETMLERLDDYHNRSFRKAYGS